MSYMNDDTDPFGVPYTPINQNPKKEIKEESPERFTYSGCIVYDKFEERKHHRYYGMGMSETVELLNTLSDENEQLKERNKKRLQRLKNQRKELEKQQEAIWGYKGDIKQLKQENEQLKSELQGMEELLKSYRKTIKHDTELLADATKNGYLPPLEDWKGDVE